MCIIFIIKVRPWPMFSTTNQRLIFCIAMVKRFSWGNFIWAVLDLHASGIIFESTNTWLLQMIWWCIKHYLIKLMCIKSPMANKNQVKEKWLHDVNFNLVIIKHKINIDTELWNKTTRVHYHPYFSSLLASLTQIVNLVFKSAATLTRNHYSKIERH